MSIEFADGGTAEPCISSYTRYSGINCQQSWVHRHANDVIWFLYDCHVVAISEGKPIKLQVRWPMFSLTQEHTARGRVADGRVPFAGRHV
uniref:Uncharacterized protein n=1 Tax=Anguilla anguilla TaxID=7936 RepID=A0A0E9WKL2_ANGAN